MVKYCNPNTVDLRSKGRKWLEQRGAVVLHSGMLSDEDALEYKFEY